MNARFQNSKLSRRRFLAISAAVVGVGLTPGIGQAGLPLHRWRGIALGAKAEIRLYHPDVAVAEDLLASAEAEIRRLEAIFSLYQTDSALARLNRDGWITAPPLDLVELLGLSGQIYRASDGAFDPSIQPLWQLYAEHYAAANGGPQSTLDSDSIETVRARTGFHHVAIAADEIRFARPGMALTLNGIAQGFITDRVAKLLRDGGMSDILVDLGEIRASGSDVSGEGWAVGLDPSHTEGSGAERVLLRDRAVASSACLGTTFDADGRIGHILDPRTGKPARSNFSGASVVASSAALADGLSTAALVCEREAFTALLKAFSGSSARLVARSGQTEWITS